MANEYAVNSADLTSVADAIREKGGTEDSLSFPAGFVTAIQDIKAGGGLGFDIVASLTRPENPSENTVWVATDQAITSHVFLATEPESPTEGMVWFMLSDDSTASFNALGEGDVLMISPTDAAQYINGEWVNVLSERYSNGEWLNWTSYLIKDGQTIYPFEALGLPWDSEMSYTSNNPKITQNTGNIQVAGSQYGCCMAFFENVNLTNRKAITIVGTHNTASYVQLCVWSAVPSQYIADTMVASAKIASKGVTLDLSSNALSGNYVVGITSQASYVQKITALYIE